MNTSLVSGLRESCTWIIDHVGEFVKKAEDFWESYFQKVSVRNADRGKNKVCWLKRVCGEIWEDKERDSQRSEERREHQGDIKIDKTGKDCFLLKIPKTTEGQRWEECWHISCPCPLVSLVFFSLNNSLLSKFTFPPDHLQLFFPSCLLSFFSFFFNYKNAQLTSYPYQVISSSQ